MIHDEIRQLRVKVLRRVVYGLNTLALEEGRVPAEGPFDAAVANGVAAILSAEQPGTEVRGSTGKVHPPGQLLDKLERLQKTSAGVPPIDVRLLKEGVLWSQPSALGPEGTQYGP